MQISTADDLRARLEGVASITGTGLEILDERRLREQWRSVAIGDAPHVRKSSLVLYPTGQRSEARRLADRLHIAAMRPETRSDILVLLGRDRS